MYLRPEQRGLRSSLGLAAHQGKCCYEKHFLDSGAGRFWAPASLLV